MVYNYHHHHHHHHHHYFNETTDCYERREFVLFVENKSLIGSTTGLRGYKFVLSLKSCSSLKHKYYTTVFIMHLARG